MILLLRIVRERETLPSHKATRTAPSKEDATPPTSPYTSSFNGWTRKNVCNDPESCLPQLYTQNYEISQLPPIKSTVNNGCRQEQPDNSRQGVCLLLTTTSNQTNSQPWKSSTATRQLPSRSMNRRDGVKPRCRSRRSCSWSMTVLMH